MTTDMITPSSSSVALGDGTNTGSEGYSPGSSHTCEREHLGITHHFRSSVTCQGRESNRTCLHALPAEVHLDQRVSDEMSEATAVEVAVGAGVVFGVVDLRELQTSVFTQILSVEVLVGAEDLNKGRNRSNVVTLTRNK